ncbi:tail fiber assembly protein [Rosenbergiella australiborealis]|uniref:tail fiber assembly protein n=1 Tax=Rosenbergiella australiborealis TaxID=1544696 RepID=UPI001F4D8EFC|nr:tail fiber assembly protein [Rosenbergiella australiborealis]
MTIEFDENGHALSEGVARVYHYDPLTGEYLGANDETIPEGVSIPGSSTLFAPGEYAAGRVWVFASGTWTLNEDYRGQTYYSTKDQHTIMIKEIGPPPSDYVALAPTSPFDVWDGSSWVIDKEAEQKAAIDSASGGKTQRLQQATDTINPLQDAVDLEMATDEEKAQLTAWRKYRVLLTRVDTSTAPDIDWPQAPTA